jgi:hypothetical protein
VSPKGYGNTFALINNKQVAYLDLGGSGIETLAHVQQNGRITFLFLNLEAGAPCILRLWGKAKAYERGTPDFDHWLDTAFSAAAQQPELHKAMRSIIVADIYESARSCGYAVPVYEFKQERDVYLDVTRRAAPDKQLACRQANSSSLDGIPGLSIPDPSVYTNTPAPAPSKPSAAGVTSRPLINVTASNSSSSLSSIEEAAGTQAAAKAASPTKNPTSSGLLVSHVQPYLSHVLVVVLTLLVSNIASLLVAAA